VSISIVSNICFFIVTTITILYQNIHTAHQMRNSESKQHNKNKRSVLIIELNHVIHIVHVNQCIHIHEKLYNLYSTKRLQKYCRNISLQDCNVIKMFQNVAVKLQQYYNIMKHILMFLIIF